MSELLKNKRVIFARKGQQGRWLQDLSKNTSIKELAEVCRCSERTIRDWKREKFHMNSDCLLRLCKTYKVALPIVRTESQFAHTKLAGQKGGKAVIEKYGKIPVSERLRKEGWNIWWNKEGKYKKDSVTNPRSIRLPRKSTKLAEFLGIMMGDGTLAPYHIAITLNAVDDLEYSYFVSKIIEELFQTEAKRYSKKDAKVLNIVVSRIKLVDYLRKLGLPKGDKVKQRLSIPNWIKSNKKYARACVRGLVDTDGSVYEHRYSVKGKIYCYTKISFTSASTLLCKEVENILKSEGIKTSRSEKNVRIEDFASVNCYVKKFKSHNPKHLKKLGK